MILLFLPHALGVLVACPIYFLEKAICFRLKHLFQTWILIIWQWFQRFPFQIHAASQRRRRRTQYALTPKRLAKQWITPTFAKRIMMWTIPPPQRLLLLLNYDVLLVSLATQPPILLQLLHRRLKLHLLKALGKVYWLIWHFYCLILLLLFFIHSLKRRHHVPMWTLWGCSYLLLYCLKIW